MERAGAGSPFVCGISYDPVEVLAEFAEQYGITYPLLADVGSNVIERLNLLNVHAEQQQAHFGVAFGERHHRMPYPGVFSLDADGIIVDRRFEQGHRIRPSGTLLLDEALAAAPDAAVVSDTAEAPGVAARAWLYTAAYRPLQRLEVHVAIAVDRGTHLYAAPVPRGFTALSLGLSGPAPLEYDPPELPSGTPFRVDGLDEDFSVLSGEIRTTVPFLIAEDVGAVDVTLTVASQACTANECYPPFDLRLTLPLESRPVLRP